MMRKLLSFLCVFMVYGVPVASAQLPQQLVYQYVQVNQSDYWKHGALWVETQFSDLVERGHILSFEKTFLINDEVLNLNYTVGFADSLSAERFFLLVDSVNWLDWSEYLPTIEAFYTPNDYNPTLSWQLQKVNATSAWDQSKGDSNITIAIVDDAILLAHHDIAPVLWNNPGEIPANGIDDDSNGFIDDVHGWDVANNDNDPSPPSGATASFFSHGTHCAGIAAAKTDNSNGMASLAFNCRIIAVKTKLDNSTGGSLQYTLQGVQYAIIAGARVVSMSFGGPSYSQTYQNLFNYGNRNNVVFVAAAGNNGNVLPMYPANYDYVISVGATDPNDIKANFSSYGANTDVMAPGTNIYSAVVGSGNNQYGYKSGTSMACPLVAGLAGLMLSKDSGLLPAQIEGCIKNTAIDIDSLNPAIAGNLGSGRIDAFAAMSCIKPINAAFISNKVSTCPGGIIQFTDRSTKNPTSWFWEFPGGAPSFSTMQNPQVLYNTPGIYSVKLKVSNSLGQDSVEITDFIRVGVPSGSISGNYTIPDGYSVNLRIELQGEPPFSFRLYDGQTYTWITNVISTPYYHVVTPMATTTYTIDSVSDNNCNGNSSGSSVVTVGSYSSPNCNQSTNAFQKIYHAAKDDLSYSIIPCSEGGFMWVGITKSVGAGDYDIFITRTNDTGFVLWSRVIGTSAEEKGITLGTKVIETRDSGFAVVGITKSSGASTNWDMLFFLLDRNGNVLKQRRIADALQDWPHDLVQTTDNGFLISGTTGSLPRTGWEDGYLVKLDTSGAVQWTRKRGFTGSSTAHYYSIVELPSGNYMMIGSGHPQGITQYLSFSAKFSPDGSILQECRLQTGQFDALRDATLLSNGNIAAVGVYSTNNGSTYSLLAMILDTSSNVLWSQIISGYPNVWGAGITATSDGGFVVNGYVSLAGQTDIINIKFNDQGNVLWSRRYGSTSDEVTDLHGKTIAEYPDGSLLFVLSTKGFGAQESDLMLIRSNPCGETGNCNESNINFTINNIGITRVVYTAGSNSGGTGSTVNYSIVDWTDSLNTNAHKICQIPQGTPAECEFVANFEIQKACVGEGSTFTDVSKDLSGNTEQVYSRWIIDGIDTITGPVTLTYTFMSDGVHSVTLISGSDGSPACFDTISMNIQIVSILNVEITGMDTVCQFDSVRIDTPMIACSQGKVSVAWSPGRYFLDSAEHSPIIALDSSRWIYLNVRDSLDNIAVDSHYFFVNQSCCKSKAKWVASTSGVCVGDSLELLNVSVAKPSASYLWFFESGSQHNSFIGNSPPKLLYPNTGEYSISLVVSDICGTDTFESEIHVIPLPELRIIADTILCQPDNIVVGENQAISSLSYRWEPTMLFSDPYIPNPEVWINAPVTIYGEVVDDWTGCSSTDSLVVTIEQVDTLRLLLDTTFCFPDSVYVSYPSSDIGIVWPDGMTDSGKFFSDSGEITVQLSKNFCTTTDTLIFRQVKLETEIVGPEIICENDSGLYIVTNIYDSVEWQSGASDSFVYISDSGWHSLTSYGMGCFIKDSIFVDQFNEHVTIFGPATICEGDSVELYVNPISDVDITWSNGDTGRSTYIREPGLVVVNSELNGCVNSDSSWLPLVPNPVIEDYQDTIFCPGDSLTIIVIPNAHGTVSWYDGSSDTIRVLRDSGMYVVRISNACHVAEDTIYVRWADCGCIPLVPNAFSPNGDGLNEVFRPELCYTNEYTMTILSFWGEIMFKTSDYSVGWDGNYRGHPALEGEYVYIITYKDPVTDKKEELSGTLILLLPKK